MGIEYNNLQQGHTYLVSRNKAVNSIFAMKILLVTNKAYHIHWDNGIETWELKEKFNTEYSLLEDISDFMTDEKKETKSFLVKEKSDYKLVPCYLCRGMGTIPQPNSTAGTKTCPACNGTKMVMKNNSMGLY